MRKTSARRRCIILLMIRTRLVALFSALCLLFGLALLAPSAHAERTAIWIASGLPGGTYRSIYARNLEKEMRDYKMYYRSSNGSGQNLDLLAEGKADIAFAQADVYGLKLHQEPERYGELLVIGKLADECIYLAKRKDGPVQDLKSLGSAPGGRPARLAAGAELGGMSGTWRFLSFLDPTLAGAEVVHEGDTLAINQLAIGRFDAVGWVTDPTNYDHKMLRALLSNDSLSLMDLTDPALLKPLPDGTRVYEAKEVDLTDSWRAKKLETLCTSALMLVRKDANPRLIHKLADVLSLDLYRIVPRKKK
jgi:hypothetical protein